MAIQHYLRYVVPFKDIYSELNKKRYKQINFYIDLASIARGFYNRTVVKMEIGNYIQSGGQMPTIFINELKEFLNDLYFKFKQ